MLVFALFFNDTATTEIYTLSLHDALPISVRPRAVPGLVLPRHGRRRGGEARLGQPDLALIPARSPFLWGRSEEPTSELQSRQYFVCCLLLEKKKKDNNIPSLEYPFMNYPH